MVYGAGTLSAIYNEIPTIAPQWPCPTEKHLIDMKPFFSGPRPAQALTYR